MSKLVSVIMNCKNGEKYLRESLNSVLNQTFKNWELIFIDNMSTDNSKKIFDQYKDERLKYFSTYKSLSLGGARQIALNHCKGEFIAFLDTDDIWFENKLEKQVPYFIDSKVGMVISNTIFFSNSKEKILFKKRPPTGYVLEELLKKYFISLETLVCRREFIDKISFSFNTEFNMISDLDLTLRLAKISKLEYCPYLLAKWRIHKNSETWRKLNIFFTEKLQLHSELQNNTNFNNDKAIQYCLSIFKNNTYFSVIYNQIMNKDSKFEILANLKKINIKNLKYYLTYLLINIPFNKTFIKLYKNFTQLRPK